MKTHPYATAAYARSLAHWGEALAVPPWGTSVILRGIDGGWQDAAGVYPFAVLAPDADIAAGLDYLHERDLVSLVMVFDAFHHPDMAALQRHFDVVRPFKTHYLYRKTHGAVRYDNHHRRALRHALQEVRVEPFDLRRDAARWQILYDHLTAKLNLTGLHAFPLAHAKALADIPGVTALGAWRGDRLISAHLWASNGKIAHSHLVASGQEGYDTQAAYAVNDLALRHCRDEEILNFGGGAGRGDAESDGLARFKRGFSNDTAPSYLCGVILDPARYESLCAARGVAPDHGYFPAYRA